jgi:hypothetical protein
MPYWEEVDDDEELDEAEDEQEDLADNLDDALFNVGVQVDDNPIDLNVDSAETAVTAESAESAETDEHAAPATEDTQITSQVTQSEYNTIAPWHADDYGDVEEHVYESKQIDVTKKSSSVEYPMLYLKLNNQSTVELNLLKNMLRTSCQDADAMYFHIYLDVCGSVIKPQGVLRNVELKTLLSSSIFSDVDKYIKLDENTTITGDMMFALCAVDC